MVEAAMPNLSDGPRQHEGTTGRGGPPVVARKHGPNTNRFRYSQGATRRSSDAKEYAKPSQHIRRAPGCMVMSQGNPVSCD